MSKDKGDKPSVPVRRHDSSQQPGRFRESGSTRPAQDGFTRKSDNTVRQVMPPPTKPGKK